MKRIMGRQLRSPWKVTWFIPWLHMWRRSSSSFRGYTIALVRGKWEVEQLPSEVSWRIPLQLKCLNGGLIKREAEALVALLSVGMGFARVTYAFLDIFCTYYPEEPLPLLFKYTVTCQWSFITSSIAPTLHQVVKRQNIMPYSLSHSEYKVTILNIDTSFQHIRGSIQKNKACLAWVHSEHRKKRNLKL